MLFQETPEDLQSIDSCEYIWEAGVGFANSPSHNAQHDLNRTEILKLLLTCFSEIIYIPPSSKKKQEKTEFKKDLTFNESFSFIADGFIAENRWIRQFTSAENR